MSDLYVILKDSFTGPDVSYVTGDQYDVESEDEGNKLVSAGLAAWPKLERKSKPTSSKPVTSEILTTTDTETVTAASVTPVPEVEETNAEKVTGE